MTQTYFSTMDTLRLHAENYLAECFRFQNEHFVCECSIIRECYEVTDRQDGEIIETLIICPRCAGKPKNNQ